jgi:hypothetical protein
LVALSLEPQALIATSTVRIVINTTDRVSRLRIGPAKATSSRQRSR